MSHEESNKRDAECFSPAHLLSVSANESSEKKKVMRYYFRLNDFD